MDKWFVFAGHNSQTQFGFGNEDEADKYCNILNREREVNLYFHYALEAPYQIAQLNSGADDSGFRLSLALEVQAEHDAWVARMRERQQALGARPRGLRGWFAKALRLLGEGR